jgi:hypothetical protein
MTKLTKQQAAIEAMTPELRKEFERIREFFDSAVSFDVRERYAVGCILRTIADAKGKTTIYGKKPMRLLADALGREKSTLYRYARVARTWKDKQFQVQSERRNCLGERLGWTYWEVLATRPNDWEMLLERTLTRGWSPQELIDEIKAMRPAKSKEGSEGSDTTATAIVNATKCVADSNKAVFHSISPILDRLRETPERSPHHARLIAVLIKALNDGQERERGLVARLERHASCQEPPTTTPLGPGKGKGPGMARARGPAPRAPSAQAAAPGGE